MISNREGYFLRSRSVQRQQKNMHHGQLKPDPFAGLPSQDSAAWYTKFQAWLALNEWTNKAEKVGNGLRLLLLPPASTWYDGLPNAVKADVVQLDQAFRERFVNNQPGWVLEQQLWGRVMQATEGLDSYVTSIDTLCARLAKTETDRITCFVRGLTPTLRPFVIQQDPKTFSAAVQSARLAQESLTVSTATSTAAASCCTTLTSTPSLQEMMAEQKKALDALQEEMKALKATPPVIAAAAANPSATCQLCSNTGHSARECRLFTDGNNGNSRRNVTCNYCQRRGHLERNCFTKRRDQRQQQQTNSNAQQSLNQAAPSK